MKSKTPRTDAEFKLEAFFDGSGIVETVFVEFARELEKELIEARAEIKESQAEAQELYRQLATELKAEHAEELAEARAEIEHWKSECNALQRMVHEARAEIERKDKLIEQMYEAIKFSLIADEVRQTRNVCASDINDACETSRIKRIAALSAAERGEGL